VRPSIGERVTSAPAEQGLGPAGLADVVPVLPVPPDQPARVLAAVRAPRGADLSQPTGLGQFVAQVSHATRYDAAFAALPALVYPIACGTCGRLLGSIVGHRDCW
jgi:hypothetical protein